MRQTLSPIIASTGGLLARSASVSGFRACTRRNEFRLLAWNVSLIVYIIVGDSNIQLDCGTHLFCSLTLTLTDSCTSDFLLPFVGAALLAGLGEDCSLSS